MSGEGHRAYWATISITDDNFYRSRSGLVPLVEMIEEIAKEYADGTQPIFVGDLDFVEDTDKAKRKKHKGHKIGREADIMVRWTKGYPADGGRLDSFTGRNDNNNGRNFVEGANYDREATFDLIKKFLDYRGTAWAPRESQLGTSRARYKVRVTDLITADESLYYRFKADPNYADRVRLDRPPVDHANHFHIKISIKPWTEETPMSKNIEFYRSYQTLPEAQRPPVITPPFSIKDMSPPKRPFGKRVLDAIRPFLGGD